MALLFGATTADRVNIPDATSIRLTASSSMTWLVWFYISTFTAGRRIMGKNGFDGNGGPFLALSGTTELQWTFAATTLNAQAVSNNLSLATGTWYCAAVDYDPADSQHNRIFFGTLTTPLAEAGYAGGGSQLSGTSPSTVPLRIGNTSEASPTTAFQGRVAIAGQWSPKLSLDDKKTQQYWGDLTVRTNCGAFYALEAVDQGGLGAQTDQSGNGNTGTPTGTSFAAHVPLTLHYGVPTYADFPKYAMRQAA